MLTIAVTSKGGVGKTTTAAALAGEFAARGRRALLVDLDPMAASLTRSLGAAPSDHPLAEEPVEIGGRHLFNKYDEPRYWLARGGPRLNVVTRADVGAWLDAHQAFDLRIIDAPPQGVGELTVAALMRADLVLIPVGESVMELHPLLPLRTLIERLPHAPPAWVFLAKVHRGRVGAARVAAWVEENWPDALVYVEIPDEARAANWGEKGIPLTLQAPNTGAAKGYRVLADMISKAFPQVGRGRGQRR